MMGAHPPERETSSATSFSGMRIGPRLALLVSILIGLICLLIVIYFPKRAQLEAERALAAKARSIALMTASDVTSALVFDDLKGIVDGITTARQNPDLAFAVVVRGDSTIASSFDLTAAESAGYRLGGGSEHVSPDGSFLCVSAPAMFRDREVGHVYIGLSLSELQENLQQSRRTVSYISLLVFFVGALSAFAIGRVISGPLNTLVISLQGIAGGQLDLRAPVGAIGELGQVAKVFNVMADNVEAAHRSLEGMNHALEDRVDERTQTLMTEIKERRRVEVDLQNTLALLNATLEATADGILVVETSGRVSEFNKRFASMWKIPQDIAAERDDKRLVAFVRNQLIEPEVFEQRVRELYGDTVSESRDTLRFVDGRIFERYSHPLRVKDQSVGRVWTFVDVTDQKHAEQAIRASLAEKEVMLKEIHHRVKNNLQIVSSLLNLQSGSIADPRDLDLLIDGQNRVRSMALIHENLYRSPNLSEVDFHNYLDGLVSSIVSSYKIEGERISFTNNAVGISLRVDAAIPCGLIISELVSNALKHAFPDNRSGHVHVDLHRDASMIVVTVSDNGVGMPPGLDVAQTQSLGLQLVHTLTEQLSGSVAVTSDKGTVWTIAFPE